MDDDAFGELAYEEDDDIGAQEHENIEQFGDDYVLDHDDFGPETSGFDDGQRFGKKDRPPKNVGKGKKRRSKTDYLNPPNKPIGKSIKGSKRGPDHAFISIGNKRDEEQFESIFNSTSPLDWHLHIGEEELSTKKRRIDVENAVSQATLRILTTRMARSQQQRVNCPIVPGSSVQGNNPNREKLPEKVLDLPPMDGGAWYGISSTDGSIRRYVRAGGSRRKLVKLAEEGEGEGDIGELEAYFELVNRIEEQKSERLLREMDRTKAELMDLDWECSTEKAGREECGTLWTEKYAPRNFLDLLTDDETNRLVLLWLRLWEAYVFNRRKGPNLLDSMSKKERFLMELEHRKDGLVLPRRKILVLYGASGVGKSSLAQIAARQAGYRPLVVPISEFPNVTELRNHLENSTNTTAIQTLFQQLTVAAATMADQQKQLKSPHSSSKSNGVKPICLIVDGLELASTEMIQFLCNWAKRSGHGTIRRPMICTCASIWQSPAMKELRMNSLALRVQHCQRERLQRRLAEICHSEGIQLDRAQMDELVQSHGQDIRLCLNTLQFVTANAARGRGHVASEQANPAEPHRTVNSAVSVSMLDVLAAIFTLDFHEDNRGIVRPPVQRARSLLNLLGQLPQEDFGRLQQLVFTNFSTVLKLSQGQCRRVLELFMAMDRGQQMIHQGQHFHLGCYLPYAMLTVHFVCAVHVSRRLQFSMAAQPFNERHRECQQVVRSLRAGAAAGQHSLGTGQLQWLLPHLLAVLQPPIQTAHAQLYGVQDQRQLQRCVQLMHTYRLQYLLKYGPAGGGGILAEAHYCFEPPFDLLACFPLPEGRKHFSLPEPVKKMIASQLELPTTQGLKRSCSRQEEEDFL